GPVFAAVARERRHLVIEHQLLLEEQPPDEGRFAVIDGSASEETQPVPSLGFRSRSFRHAGAGSCNITSFFKFEGHGHCLQKALSLRVRSARMGTLIAVNVLACACPLSGVPGAIAISRQLEAAAALRIALDVE